MAWIEQQVKGMNSKGEYTMRFNDETGERIFIDADGNQMSKADFDKKEDGFTRKAGTETLKDRPIYDQYGRYTGTSVKAEKSLPGTTPTSPPSLRPATPAPTAPPSAPTPVKTSSFAPADIQSLLGMAPPVTPPAGEYGALFQMLQRMPPQLMQAPPSPAPSMMQPMQAPPAGIDPMQQFLRTEPQPQGSPLEQLMMAMRQRNA